MICLGVSGMAGEKPDDKTKQSEKEHKLRLVFNRLTNILQDYQDLPGRECADIDRDLRQGKHGCSS